MQKLRIYKIINTFDWITFSIDSSDPKINENIGRGFYPLRRGNENKGMFYLDNK